MIALEVLINESCVCKASTVTVEEAKMGSFRVYTMIFGFLTGSKSVDPVPTDFACGGLPVWKEHGTIDVDLNN